MRQPRAPEPARNLERLLQDLHAVDPGDDDIGRQVEGVLEALDSRHGFDRRMIPFASGFMPKTPIRRFTSSGSTSFSKQCGLRRVMPVITVARPSRPPQIAE
jgi:hypothetical protein